MRSLIALGVIAACALVAQPRPKHPADPPPLPAGHIQALAATVAGRPVPGLTGLPLAPAPPLILPAFSPYFMPPSYFFPAAPAPVTVIHNQVSAPPTHVVINNNSPAPPPEAPQPSGMREFSAPGPPAVEPERAKETIYLIAFKDGSVQAAVAWWVDQDALHFVTPRRDQKRENIEHVDRELSIRLNRERGVEFKLK